MRGNTHLQPLFFRHGPLGVYVQYYPFEAFLEPLVAEQPPTEPLIWLDSAREHPVTGRWSLLGWDPWLTIKTDGRRVERHTSACSSVTQMHPFEALSSILERFAAMPSASPCSRAIGIMGYISYEMNRWIERLPDPQAIGRIIPEMAWYAMRKVILVDHHRRCTWLVSVVDPHQPEVFAHRAALDAVMKIQSRVWPKSVRSPTLCPSAKDRETAGIVFRPEVNRIEFEASVRSIQESIAEGEIFQANLSQRFQMPWEGDPRRLYAYLREINPSPFACYLADGDLAIVSCSPERLVRVQEGVVDTRPIAGTRPRGLNPEQDALNELDLLMNEKERAEHVMLVDLARNDLGRICDVGSVQVNDFMSLERYSHVMHIISDVGGRLRKNKTAVDVIQALFPGGTITGCPKVRCMEILRAEEKAARGIYTGSLGYIGFDGTMDLNIAIRTMVRQRNQLSFHVGAGIVADSDPGREYEETLAKGQALVESLARYQHEENPNVALA